MANTYTQIHIQIIFAVKFRKSMISESWESSLYKYITTIIQNNGHKLLQINGMPDHIHILIGMKPIGSLSDLVKEIKRDSSKWINNEGLTQSRFEWQKGYSAFSYSNSHIDKVIAYIRNQKEHHRKQTFKDEYLEFLEKFDVFYDERYLFKPPASRS